MKLPVLKAFFAGFALFFGKPGELLKALWLPALLLLAILSVIMPHYLAATLQFSSAELKPDPENVIAAMAPLFKYLSFLYLTMAIFYPMMSAGNLKYIIRGDALRLPFYLRYGIDEIRILITAVLLMVMATLAYLTGRLALLVPAAIGALGGAVGAGLLTMAAAAAFSVAMIWFLLRMSVALPAAIGARKIGLAESWRLTRGNAGRLSVYWLLWLAVFVVVATVFFGLAVPQFQSALGEVFDAAARGPEAAQAAQARLAQLERELWDMSKPGFWRYIVGAYAYLLIYSSLLNVASGVAYRYLSGGHSSA